MKEYTTPQDTAVWSAMRILRYGQPEALTICGEPHLFSRDVLAAAHHGAEAAHLPLALCSCCLRHALCCICGGAPRLTMQI